jgi:hypothetical protein
MYPRFLSAIVLCALTACSVSGPHPLSNEQRRILEAAISPEAEPSVTSFVQQRMSFLSSAEAFEMLLSAARNDPDPFVRNWGVWALSCEDKDLLITYLKDSAPEVRTAAFAGLMQCPDVCAYVWDTFGDSLLTDPSRNVREVVFSYCSDRELGKCLHQSIHETERSVRRALYTNLSPDLFSIAPRPELKRQQDLVNDTIAEALKIPNDGFAPAEILAHYAGRETVVPLVNQALKHFKDPEVRVLLLSALIGTSRDTQARRALVPYLRNSDEQVRFSAWKAITTGETCTSPQPDGSVKSTTRAKAKRSDLPLAQGLSDRSERIRMLVVQRCAIDAPLESLLSTLRSAHESSRADVLRAIALQVEAKKLRSAQRNSLRPVALHYREGYSKETALAASRLLEALEEAKK